MEIIEIINELNVTNSSNDKIKTLTEHKDNLILQRVLKMTYDKVKFTFGATMKNVKAGTSENTNDLEWGLNQLDKLANREVTGNNAVILIQDTLEAMSEANREVIIKILNRDLRINMGRTNINKVIKGLITKPVYQRCEVGRGEVKLPNGKTKKSTFDKISYPAIVNLKSDGTFRATEMDAEVVFLSRQGEEYKYDFAKHLVNETGFLNGEMTVILDDDLLQKILPKIEKADKKNKTATAKEIKDGYARSKEQNREYILPRSLGNGLLNSDDVPQDNIIYEVWDLITPEDMNLASLKDKNNLPKEDYRTRFLKLKALIQRVNHPRIRLIEYKEVQNLDEAMQFTLQKMEEGLEGAVLKDYSAKFKDGTSALQLKLKLEVEGDFVVTGFIEGKKGTKRELTFGSLTFESSDGIIKGSTSGFNDEMLEMINTNREFYVGKIIEVHFNDLTKGRNNLHYALSHPRFKTFREDKTEADTFERVLDSVNMAKGLKG